MRKGHNLSGEAGDDVLNWDSEQVVLAAFQSGPNTLVSGGDGYDTLRVNVDAAYYLAEEDYQFGPFVSDINLWHSIYGGGDTYIKLGHSPGRPEEFHLQPPTEPCVNLSIYTARPSHLPATLR
jgi:hypothetical protein